MKKKTMQWVWDDEEFFTTRARPFAGAYAPLWSTDIWIRRPVDNPIEAERLYKENHNSERANAEWAWLDKLCLNIHNKYRKLWGLNEKL
jgi:hypothetical protein